jgi:hypothetical protein
MGVASCRPRSVLGPDSALGVLLHVSNHPARTFMIDSIVSGASIAVSG